MYNHTGLLHGKFFNLEEFWKFHDIHFNNIITNEDIYIMNIIKSYAKYYLIDIYKCDFATYIWYNNSESLSHSKIINYNGEYINYKELCFIDYMTTTRQVFVDFYNQGILNKGTTMLTLVEYCMQGYLYLQFFMSLHGNDYLQKYINICKDQLDQIRDLLDINNDSILAIAEERNIDKMCTEASEKYSLKYTFSEWLDFLNNSQ